MGKKAAIGLILIIGFAGGVAGWYFFLRPKEADYSGLLLLPLLLPEIPTPPVNIESSVVNNTNHGVGIFAGSYSMKNIFAPTVPTFPDLEIPLIGKIEVKNTTDDNGTTYIGTSQFRYINLFEDAKLKMTNVSYPNLEINCFGKSKLTIDNCTIGSIYARDYSTVTVKNSSVTTIFDMDPIFSALYEVLDVDADAIDSKIKILQGSNVGAVIITAGADAEIDSSTVGFMQAASSDSAKPSVINITNSIFGFNITLGASTDTTINTLNIAGGVPPGVLRLEGDARALATSLTVYAVMVVQGAWCNLTNSAVTGLAYGVICGFGTTTINNFAPSGAFYQNNTVLTGTVISEAMKICVSVLAVSATAIIQNCGGPIYLDSVMAVGTGIVTMDNSASNYTIGRDSSSLNISNSNLTAVILEDNSQAQINTSTVPGTMVGVSAGGVALMFPVGIRMSDNSILYLSNSTAFAITAGDSSQLYMDNITITLQMDIETKGIVRLTDTIGNNWILSLEVGMGSQGEPVGDVLIQGARIMQASVQGTAVVNFTNCDFTFGILLGGIIVSVGTAVIMYGIQV
ncbi:MAG: hypothetical protein HWN67_12390, partial [Candidatus Helarchaeota archaeon]|nr:hypothetical protein [Candidatus Helarchaeota archaeon]